MKKLLTCLAGMLLGVSLPAQAQAPAGTYPVKPVKVIVPYPPGGPTDIVARVVFQQVSDSTGQQFIVENRAGAGNNIGTEQVTKAAPDGYTMLLVNPANAINTSLYKKLNFNFLRDIDPVASVIQVPNVMEVNPNVPAKTVPEFIAYVKANPDKVNVASSGNGTSIHLSGELFKMMTGIKMTHVPYKGTAPALQDLVGGQINFMMDTPMPAMLPQVRAGKVKALGMASDKRIAIAPEVPTLIEQGVQVVGGTWVALLAPAGTPKAIVDKLSGAAGAAMRRPEIKERLAQFGIEPVGSTSAEFTQFLKKEVAKWAKVIKDANVRID